MKKEKYLINEAAKEVRVEPHVLRYWEDELGLPIGRNVQGHRIYTQADIDRFIEIKGLKEQGLQLKAVKTLLCQADGRGEDGMKNMIEIKEMRALDGPGRLQETLDAQRAEQMARLQYLFQKLVKEAVAANNEEMAQEIAGRVAESVKSDICKELDYQFRLMEERDEEQAVRRREEEDRRGEDYYRRIDELLRQYSGKGAKQKNKEKTIIFPSAKAKDMDKGTSKEKKGFGLFRKNVPPETAGVK